MKSEHLKFLVCPECKGRLNIDGKNMLVCAECGRKYPVIDGLPVLLEEKEAMNVFYSSLNNKQSD